MRVAVIVLMVVLVLSVVACTADAKWKEPRKSRSGPGEVVTRGDLDCSGAIPIALGQTIRSSNVGAPTNVDGYPVCIGWDESGGEVVFELTLDGPASLDIGVSLWSGEYSECDLDWFFLGSCDESDCIEYDDYGWPIYNLAPGTYYIVVDGADGDECEFMITVYHIEPVPECGPLDSVCHLWDFNVSPEGFGRAPCASGVVAWSWGPPPFGVPDMACGNPVTNVLGAGIGGGYPNNAGEVAGIGPVMITEDCYCFELCHWYEIETGYDGGMVVVTTDNGLTWDFVSPARGYDLIGEWDNDCIGPFPCFSSEVVFDFIVDYFDLSPWIGSEVIIGFVFGSDSSVRETGWHIARAALGGHDSPVEHSSWGAIKGLYR